MQRSFQVSSITVRTSKGQVSQKNIGVSVLNARFQSLYAQKWRVGATKTSQGVLSAEEEVVRVLRYPDGQERRIRYPAHLLIKAEDSVSAFDSTDSIDFADSVDRGEDWWGIESYYYGSSSDEDDEVTTEILGRNTSQNNADVVSPNIQPSTKGFPSSPAELLRYINSDQYKSAAAEQLRLVRDSYQVVEHSPWLQTKSLSVLAIAQPDSEAFMTYTLRTRVSRPEQEDELSKVLKKRRADGSNLIRMEEIRDGVIAFENENDAHRYSAMLEAEGTQAVVAQCDSHTLFREVSSTRAVVVLVKECLGLQCHLPLPKELTSALKAKPSLEDPVDL